MHVALAVWPSFVLIEAAERAIELSEEALKPLGIRPRHYGVLSMLAELGPISQHAMGEHLRVDRTSMVGLVDDLEKLGLVQRQRDPKDRRAYALQLTEAGEETVSQASQLVSTAERELLSPLDAAERRQLHELLRRVV